MSYEKSSSNLSLSLAQRAALAELERASAKRGRGGKVTDDEYYGVMRRNPANQRRVKARKNSGVGRNAVVGSYSKRATRQKRSG